MMHLLHPTGEVVSVPPLSPTSMIHSGESRPTPSENRHLMPLPPKAGAEDHRVTGVYPAGAATKKSTLAKIKQADGDLSAQTKSPAESQNTTRQLQKILVVFGITQATYHVGPSLSA